MEPTLRAVRAIAVELFLRVYRTVAWIVFIILGILLALSVWLTTFSAWWWILFAVVALWIVVALLFFVISYTIVRAVRPMQTSDQKQQLKLFVDKIERVKEVAEVPKFIVLFRVVRDAVRPTRTGYIASLSDDAVSLKNDFIEYRNSFRSQ